MWGIETWSGIVAMLISVLTFIFGVLGLRGRARKDYVEEMRTALIDLRGKFDECEKARRALHEENYRLMSRLIERE